MPLKDGDRFNTEIFGLQTRWKVKYQKLLGGDTKVMLVRVDYNPLPEGLKCKSCGSTRIYRHGLTRSGIQRYKCRDCGLTFIGGDALPRMRVPPNVIGAAISMFYEGMSLNAIRRQIYQIYDIYPSDSTVYEWVTRFTKVAVKATKECRPRVGNTWTGDETVLKIGGENTWFWDIIDEDTRFLLASHLSPSRRTKDAQTLMLRAGRRAKKAPKRIITDKLASYLDGIERVFGAASKHVQSGPFKIEDSSRSIERFHGTLKARTKVMRGMQNRDTANLITDGWLVHYNYLRPHEGLKGKTPAEAARLNVSFRNWTDIVRMSE